MRKVLEFFFFVAAFVVFIAMLVWLVKEFPYWDGADYLAAFTAAIVLHNVFKTNGQNNQEKTEVS